MTPLRRTALTGAAVLLAGVLGACAGGADEPAMSGSGRDGGDGGDGVAVSVKSLAFSPAKTTARVGSSVTWTNDEPITHTVTSGAVTGIDPTTQLRSGQRPDGMFDGRLDASGATFSFTFTKAGTYSYFCSIHQGMNAQVVVDPA